MTRLLSDFLGEYQRGVEVAVSGGSPEEMLGVREAFRRYFHDGLERPSPVAVVPQAIVPRHQGIAESDAAAIQSARKAVRALEARLGTSYQFYVATEVCVQDLIDEGTRHFFLRCWSVVLGPAGEALGASGSLELPGALVEGLGRLALPMLEPSGTRRAGGLIAAFTGGLETRRSAVALATLQALATMFHGILESRRG
jgi:hypothetical protein